MATVSAGTSELCVIAQTPPLFCVMPNGTSYAAFGHRAACGAAAGVCVPALGVSVAVTVSRLTDAKSTTSQLLGAALRGCGVVKLEGF